MTEQKKGDSYQKATFVKRENTTSKNGHPSTKLTYIWHKDDGTQKQMEVSWVNKFLSDDSKKIYESLGDGSQFVVVKEDKGKGYWFKELKDISTYVPKPAWDGNKGGSKGGYQKKEYDQQGSTIGMMFNNSVASVLKEHGKYDREKVLKLAKDMVKDVQEFDAYARPILEAGGNKQAEEDKSKQESYQQDQYSPDTEPPF